MPLLCGFNGALGSTNTTYTNTADCMYSRFRNSKFFCCFPHSTFCLYYVICNDEGPLFNRLIRHPITPIYCSYYFQYMRVFLVLVLLFCLYHLIKNLFIFIRKIIIRQQIGNCFVFSNQIGIILFFNSNQKISCIFLYLQHNIPLLNIHKTYHFSFCIY